MIDSLAVKTFYFARFESPFGHVLIGVCDGCLARVEFIEEVFHSTEEYRHALGWPHPDVIECTKRTAPFYEAIFGGNWGADASVEVLLVGTEFQKRVWTLLREVPFGETITYAELADQLGKPGAARAVGSAVGANRLACVIPCHRVVRADGKIGDFRWGRDLKTRLLAYERSSLRSKN